MIGPQQLQAPAMTAMPPTLVSIYAEVHAWPWAWIVQILTVLFIIVQVVVLIRRDRRESWESDRRRRPRRKRVPAAVHTPAGNTPEK